MQRQVVTCPILQLLVGHFPTRQRGFRPPWYAFLQVEWLLGCKTRFTTQSHKVSFLGRGPNFRRSRAGLDGEEDGDGDADADGDADGDNESAPLDGTLPPGQLGLQERGFSLLLMYIFPETLGGHEKTATGPGC